MSKQDVNRNNETVRPLARVAARELSLEEIAAEMGDRVRVAKLNIDDNPMTPGRYGVRGIPTLMVFKDGKVAATKVGAMPKSKIVEWLNESV